MYKMKKPTSFYKTFVTFYLSFDDNTQLFFDAISNKN